MQRSTRNRSTQCRFEYFTILVAGRTNPYVMRCNWVLSTAILLFLPFVCFLPSSSHLKTFNVCKLPTHDLQSSWKPDRFIIHGWHKAYWDSKCWMASACSKCQQYVCLSRPLQLTVKWSGVSNKPNIPRQSFQRAMRRRVVQQLTRRRWQGRHDKNIHRTQRLIIFILVTELAASQNLHLMHSR